MKKQYSATFKVKLVMELLRGEKALTQLASEHQVHPNQLRNWRALLLNEAHTLFDKTQTKVLIATHEQEKEELYAQIGLLTTQLTWLKKNLVSILSSAERRALLERDAAAELSVTRQAELLGVSRSSVYYRVAPPCAEEVAVKHRIDRLYTEWPTYGSRRMAAQLRREGYAIGRERVQRYLREMGLEALYPGPKTSRRNPEHKVYPYLLRDLTIDRRDQVWGIDITYIPLRRGWMYLVAILDWYSRCVVSWELSDNLEIGFVLRAVERALAEAAPEIWNSDQGSHFTSLQYTKRLLAAGVKISMDGKGRALDNIFTERFWRTVKYDEVYLHGYEVPRDAERGLGRFLPRYNEERLHSSLGYVTPAEVYLGGARPAQIHLGKKTREETKKEEETTLEKGCFLS